MGSQELHEMVIPSGLGLGEEQEGYGNSARESEVGFVCRLEFQATPATRCQKHCRIAFVAKLLYWLQLGVSKAGRTGGYGGSCLQDGISKQELHEILMKKKTAPVSAFTASCIYSTSDISNSMIKYAMLCR